MKISGSSHRPYFILIMFIVFQIVIISCSSKRTVIPATPEQLAVLQKIYDEEMQNYQSFKLFPGTSRLMDSESRTSAPHGRYVTVYANDIAFNAASDKAEALPDGSLLIKDAYTSEKELRATIIMKKIQGKWHFGTGTKPDSRSRFGKSGEPVVASCSNCHLKAKNDQVFVWQNR